ncbi:MAG: 50S ribosomal protein L24 [Candidatus Micrarchaeia archaeon]
MVSSKPRKQRKARYNADLHIMQKFANAHLDKQLAKKLNIKRRSVRVREGDTVKVTSGKNKGKSGKVNRVDLKNNFVYIDGITRKTAKGKEIMIPIRPSNLYITDLNLSDKYRKEKLNISG